MCLLSVRHPARCWSWTKLSQIWVWYWMRAFPQPYFTMQQWAERCLCLHPGEAWFVASFSSPSYPELQPEEDLWKSGCGLICQMSFSLLEQRWVYTNGCKGVQFTADREEGMASFHRYWISVWRWEDLGLDSAFSFTAGQSLTMQMPHLLYEHDLQKPNLIFFSTGNILTKEEEGWCTMC